MLYLIASIIGFALGWFTAAKKGGNLADKVQYGVIFAMLAMLLLMITVLVLGAIFL